MPLYIFEHPETGEIIEVLQRMKDKHEYVDEKGIEWRRIFTSPGATIDTQVDPFSKSQFVDKTKGKGMTMGQLWDESARASEKRAKILGKDPVKEKYFKDYSGKRQGVVHQDDPKTKKTPKTNRANPFT